VTRDAIHKRIHRGSIQHEKGEDGRLYVYVDTSTLGLDSSTDTSKDESKVEALERILEHQQDRIAFLERELERKDAILLNMTEAMKAIAPPAQEEAPPEPPEASVTATEQPGRVEAQSQVEGAQEAGERVSWWRRVFGVGE
jgi:hypothetical protein